MRDLFKAIFSNSGNTIDRSGGQVMIMGGALIVFNALLMFCLSVYWINPVVHQYISGKPL